jgi:hypothetical protein
VPEKQGHDAFSSGRFLASRTGSRESRVRETVVPTRLSASANESAHDDDDGAATARCDEVLLVAFVFGLLQRGEYYLGIYMRTRDGRRDP